MLEVMAKTFNESQYLSRTPTPSQPFTIIMGLLIILLRCWSLSSKFAKLFLIYA